MISAKGKVRIQSYKDLLVWQKSHKLAIRILELSRKANRNKENFFIWSQILRAAFSVPANIVEGYYSHRGKNYLSKLEIARGEAGETEYWLFVLFEIADLDEMTYNALVGECKEVILMLSAIIKKLT
ncbi:MAG: four helix bundle protein [Candidatus Daviesbacteria bacterium]|nr:four helix bundle protein [Candidatus Daviesbacteria bacterium]